MIHFLLSKQYANWNNIKEEIISFQKGKKRLGNLNIKIHFSRLKEWPTILINVNKCKAKIMEKVVEQVNVPSPDQTNVIKKINVVLAFLIFQPDF